MSNPNAPSGASLDAISRVFECYDTPLWLVTACDGERRGGLVATSVTRASIVDSLPRMLICIARQHYTWALIESRRRCALHLLQVSDLAAIWRFGLPSGHEVDKYADLDPATTPDANPLYGDAVAWLDGRVEFSADIGDRSLYLLEIVDGSVLRDAPALTLNRLLKDAPPERRDELQRLYARDQAIDAAAIQRWRATSRVD
ncbi:flavin reductase domain protein FMN-binding [Thiorhodococcus drewsii AZ1]|uniref:Flavin reductase domain protein FMN-binding n=1 Tax=Thiorhodococcus drewsii AZ1 TaxID=765913 RepID=G2E3S1_9GAMM|nr:flavin reductase family protein [Thiorhodococcus drewsii]EGV30013.1 flavin reductase domain protein FMN-binding [Thiorhodococcus drewsii AZ1]